MLLRVDTGSDVMRRIAAPMAGEAVTLFIGLLLAYRAICFVWRSIGLQRSPLFPERHAPRNERSIQGAPDNRGAGGIPSTMWG